MPTPASAADEFFAAVRDLATQLETADQAAAAKTLLDGLASLNGLTDGWALLLDAISQCMPACRNNSELLKRLSAMEESVYRVVYRRKMWPWTKFFRRCGTRR